MTRCEKHYFWSPKHYMGSCATSFHIYCARMLFKFSG